MQPDLPSLFNTCPSGHSVVTMIVNLDRIVGRDMKVSGVMIRNCIVSFTLIFYVLIYSFFCYSLTSLYLLLLLFYYLFKSGIVLLAAEIMSVTCKL